MFLADFSNFCKFSSLLSISTYWLYMWLQGSSSPTGLANDRRQSERSVDSFSYLTSVDTLPGRSPTSESVCRQRRLLPIRISSGERQMSCRQALSSGISEK